MGASKNHTDLAASTDSSVISKACLHETLQNVSVLIHNERGEIGKLLVGVGASFNGTADTLALRPVIITLFYSLALTMRAKLIET